VWVVGAEASSGALGFAALVHQARFLGPASFARVEYAVAVTSWLLVLVRGGVDVVVYREAARKPRLIGPLTDLLIGLRCVAAGIGLTLVALIAWVDGPERAQVLLLTGLVLFASAWVTDVGPRATGRLGWVAFAQTVRSIGFAATVFLLVRREGDALRAAGCLVGAEAIAALVALFIHILDYGLPRARLKRRASLVLARKGLLAGMTRFGRVSLYGADMLVLGWWVGGELGVYAAARRVVFALIALGLVVPAALGPLWARAWLAGAEPARRRLTLAFSWIWGLGLPAAVGLSLTADRWMTVLFGPAYHDGGPWLALLAARLPWLLAASTAQTALVAFRREVLCLKIVATQIFLAAMLVPALALRLGPWGVGWAMLAIEAAGAVAGWAALARLGAAPSWVDQLARPLIGCLGLIAAYRLSREMPLALHCLTAAIAYGLAYRACSRLLPLHGPTRGLVS
jgi:O-antigen/teichoic acid export membrane protein